MPQLDMPIEELRRYYGSSPKPKDIDQFWEKQMVQIEAHDAKAIWEKVNINIPFGTCYDLYFTGTREARIHAKVVVPSGTGKKPAILKFHGYSNDAGEFTSLMHYAASGFVIAALDCRGQGGKSQDTGIVSGNTLFGHVIKGVEDGAENLYYRDVYLDIVILSNIIKNMPQVDEMNLAAVGLSQGGALTLACAALVENIKCLVPIYPFLSDFKRVWDMDLDQKAYSGIRDYLRHFDPLHKNIDYFFDQLSYIDVSNLVHRIKGKVLFAATLLDEICPPSTQFAAYNQIESPKEMLIYYDFGHEHLPGIEDKTLEFLLEWKSTII